MFLSGDEYQIQEASRQQAYNMSTFVQYALIGLGSIMMIMGVLISYFLSNVYCPFYLYGSASLISISLGLGALLNPKIKEHIHDLSTFAYLFIYLTTVYLTFRNGFEPHFTVLLISAHILFALSFKSILEFSLFAISSIGLLMLISHLTINAYLNPYMFISLLTLLTVVIGIYVWYKEINESQQTEKNELLDWLLNKNNEAIFILNQDCTKIMFHNKAAKNFLKFVGEKEFVSGSRLLDLLGLNRNFMVYRFKMKRSNIQEHCYCGIELEDGKNLFLELLMNRIPTRDGSGVLIKMRDNTPSQYQNGMLSHHVTGYPDDSWLSIHKDRNTQKINVSGLLDLIVENVKLEHDLQHVDFMIEIVNLVKLEADIQMLSLVIQELLIRCIPTVKDESHQENASIRISTQGDETQVSFIIREEKRGTIFSLKDNLSAEYLAEYPQNGAIELPIHVKGGY